MQKICSVNESRAAFMFRPSFHTCTQPFLWLAGLSFIYTKHRSTVLYSPAHPPDPSTPTPDQNHMNPRTSARLWKHDLSMKATPHIQVGRKNKKKKRAASSFVKCKNKWHAKSVISINADFPFQCNVASITKCSAFIFIFFCWCEKCSRAKFIEIEPTESDGVDELSRSYAGREPRRTARGVVRVQRIF